MSYSDHQADAGISTFDPAALTARIDDLVGPAVEPDATITAPGSPERRDD